MISQTQIVRLVEGREFRQLIDRILSNGRCRSALARNVLCQPQAMAPAAIGLALQRLSEITYRPSSLADRLARHLLSMQQADGFFSNGASPSMESLLAGTAPALRGLITCIAQKRAAGCANSDTIDAAIAGAVAAIGNLYRDSRMSSDNAIGWAIVLWQLGDVAEVRNNIPVDELLARLDETAADLMHDDLCRYAHAMAA